MKTTLVGRLSKLVMFVLFCASIGCSHSNPNEELNRVADALEDGIVDEKPILVIDAFAMEEGRRDSNYKITLFNSGKCVHVDIQGISSMCMALEESEVLEFEKIANKKTHGTWVDDAETPTYEINLDYLTIVHEAKILELADSITGDNYFSDFFSDREGSWEEKATEVEEFTEETGERVD